LSCGCAPSGSFGLGYPVASLGVGEPQHAGQQPGGTPETLLRRNTSGFDLCDRIQHHRSGAACCSLKLAHHICQARVIQTGRHSAHTVQVLRHRLDRLGCCRGHGMIFRIRP
jgi:hypothetical protein